MNADVILDFAGFKNLKITVDRLRQANLQIQFYHVYLLFTNTCSIIAYFSIILISPVCVADTFLSIKKSPKSPPHN